jgi:high-affinity nickel permease
MNSDSLLFVNAFLLGLRHGCDWDHLAAISDIIGTTRSVKLSTSYVVGHATVVVLLGAAVILAGNFMPSWLEAVAEKLVGVTLVALGGWLAWNILRAQQSFDVPMRSYGLATTFGVGMIHGVGAETGTQMLLLASVGGAGNTVLAICLLAAFVVGLLISNSAIALAGIAGFTAARFNRLSTALGVAAAAFSVAVGVRMLL